jgi:hypothetical protein
MSHVIVIAACSADFGFNWGDKPMSKRNFDSFVACAGVCTTNPHYSANSKICLPVEMLLIEAVLGAKWE